MKNRPYPYYELVQAKDMKDMMEVRARENTDDLAFWWSEKKDVIVKKTFGDYKNDVDALGTFIFGEGLKDKHIVIVGENCYEWIVAFMAIINGSSCAVLIDKELPADRVRELAEQADSTAVFASDKQAEYFSETDLKVYKLSSMQEYIEKGRASIEAGDTSLQDNEIDREKLAAIFFTSGTTGKSKGVMLNQRNMAQDINFACKHFVPAGDTLAALPFHHAFGLMTAVFAVFNYRKAAYINKSLKQIQRDLKIAKPATMLLVPLFVETFYKLIMNSVRKQKKEKKLAAGGRISNMLLAVGIDKRDTMFQEVRDGLGGNLKSIISGGAHLDPKYVKAFRTWGIDIMCGYGITECSPVLSVNRNEYWKDGSVGPALPGCEVKINEEGHIVTKGDHVMMGYYKNEEATAEVMKDGWFDTGDLGRIDEDGFIFITGREKNLIILSNGENVSPEEIENEFLKHEEIAEVVVFGEKGKLVAEIFPAEGHIGDQEFFDKIAEKWSKGQPAYKKISKVVLRDTEFEKNSTKKIIRYKKQDS